MTRPQLGHSITRLGSGAWRGEDQCYHLRGQTHTECRWSPETRLGRLPLAPLPLCHLPCLGTLFLRFPIKLRKETLISSQIYQTKPLNI